MVAQEAMRSWRRQFCLVGFGLVTALALLVPAGGAVAAEDAKPGERFEIAGVKAVRPTLVDTIAALQRHDIAGAKAAFEAYDSMWNGIEMYVNTRSKDMYDGLEHVLQARIEKALNAPSLRGARRRPSDARQI